MRNDQRAVKSFSLYRKSEIKSRIRFVLELLLLLAIIILSTLVLRFGYHQFMCRAYPVKFDDYVTKYADLYDFEPSFVYAIIRTESGFDKNAVSSADAVGLMQITHDTFEWAQSRTPEKESLSADSLHEPEVNIRYGLYIMSLLRNEFEDTRTMLAAYNAGIGNVRKWLTDSRYSDDGVTLKIIPFGQTRNYVKKIPAAKRIYKELYNID